jgi:hypothetical protein
MAGGATVTAPAVTGPDLSPGTPCSRFDPEARVVLYNDRHPDYLLVKDDEPALLDFGSSASSPCRGSFTLTDRRCSPTRSRRVSPRSSPTVARTSPFYTTLWDLTDSC